MRKSHLMYSAPAEMKSMLLHYSWISEVRNFFLLFLLHFPLKRESSHKNVSTYLWFLDSDLTVKKRKKTRITRIRVL